MNRKTRPTLDGHSERKGKTKKEREHVYKEKKTQKRREEEESVCVRTHIHIYIGNKGTVDEQCSRCVRVCVTARPRFYFFFEYFDCPRTKGVQLQGEVLIYIRRTKKKSGDQSRETVVDGGDCTSV